MLSKAQINEIAKAIGVDAKVLAEGITSVEEVKIEGITLPKANQFSNEELVTLKDNVSKEGYDRGAPAGREMFIKDINKAAGFEEGSGHKTPAEIIEAYKANVLKAAKIEPTQKITDLEASISKLQNTITEKDSDYAKLQGDFDVKNTYSKVESFIPTLPEGLGLKKNEVVDLFLKNHEITDDGIKHGGNILKDNMEKALGLDKVIDNFVTERGWKVAPTGRGGGAGGVEGKPTSMADFKAVIAEQGHNEGSMEANAILSEMIKENPDLGDE